MKIDKKINIINSHSNSAKEFFKFNLVDFSALRYNNKLLNEYLDKELNYNENDV